VSGSGVNVCQKLVQSTVTGSPGVGMGVYANICEEQPSHIAVHGQENVFICVIPLEGNANV
jgi:hypothetical protein